MSDPLLYLATVVMAQASPPPVPPAPPPIKGGTFTCRIMDRTGAQHPLVGELGNWRQVNGAAIADIRLDVPGNAGFSIRTVVRMKPLTIAFDAYDDSRHASVTGILDVDHDPKGRIMIERQVFAPGSSNDQYVGFCETQFSTAPRNLPA